VNSGKPDLREKWRRSLRAEAVAIAGGDASRRIAARLGASGRFREAARVGLFHPFPWEPDLLELWRGRPDACAFPHVRPHETAMEYYRVRSPDDFEPGPFGLLHPKPDPRMRVIGWGPDDLVLVPGRFFDRKGGRIGSGSGYYDRFLAALPSWRLGVCFETQVASTELAQEPTDARMDALCTEGGLAPCASGRRGLKGESGW